MLTKRRRFPDPHPGVGGWGGGGGSGVPDHELCRGIMDETPQLLQKMDKEIERQEHNIVYSLAEHAQKVRFNSKKSQRPGK